MGCCCCCCLHWVGALAGGLIGYCTAWRRPDYQLRKEVRSHAHAGFGIGLAVTFIAVVLSSWLQGVAAFFPAALFLPVLLAVLVAGYCALRLDKPRRQEATAHPPGGEEQGPAGVYRAVRFHEQQLVDQPEYASRRKEEAGLLWRVFGRTLGYAILGMIIGYLGIFLLFL